MPSTEIDHTIQSTHFLQSSIITFLISCRVLSSSSSFPAEFCQFTITTHPLQASYSPLLFTLISHLLGSFLKSGVFFFYDCIHPSPTDICFLTDKNIMRMKVYLFWYAKKGKFLFLLPDHMLWKLAQEPFESFPLMRGCRASNPCPLL